MLLTVPSVLLTVLCMLSVSLATHSNLLKCDKGQEAGVITRADMQALLRGLGEVIGCFAQG